jgi:hypothetical protein
VAAVLLWASASDAVSTAAGTAKPNVASPRREKAVRREMISSSRSVIFNLRPQQRVKPTVGPMVSPQPRNVAAYRKSRFDLTQKTP